VFSFIIVTVGYRTAEVSKSDSDGVPLPLRPRDEHPLEGLLRAPAELLDGELRRRAEHRDGQLDEDLLAAAGLRTSQGRGWASRSDEKLLFLTSRSFSFAR
jgi:hypothetical protein